MPELPEVETVCAGLRNSVLGHTIENVTLNRPDLRIPFPKNFNKQVQNQKIDTVTRRAKYILMNLNGGQTIAIHLGMSGWMTILNADDEYMPQKHDHMIITCKNGAKMILNDARRFGMVFLVDTANMNAHSAFAHLGPEPLGNEFSGPVLKEKLRGRITSVKQAIMDQRIVVGVGNIYACEALYRSGISPKKKSKDVTKAACDRLVANIRYVLNEAITAGGSSLKDYRRINGELGYFQHNFSVYDREYEKCTDCDCDFEKTKGIRRIVQSGRSTFFCPQKQK
ncbi:MAG: bifunctional DNA-formamidopyrimidine glycosylase/DNA-(apurinic or apyrimidinic site) lyase [Pseudomonadota bacterium]